MRGEAGGSSRSERRESRRGRANVEFTNVAAGRGDLQGTQQAMMVRPSGGLLFFFLASHSAVDGMEGCEEGKEEAGMYVRTLAVFLSFLSLLPPRCPRRLVW